MLKTTKNMPPFSIFCARPLRKKDTAAASHLEVVVAERLRCPRACRGREVAHKPSQFTHDIHFNLRKPCSLKKHTPHATLCAYVNIFFLTPMCIFHFHTTYAPEHTGKHGGFQGGPRHLNVPRGRAARFLNVEAEKHPLQNDPSKTDGFSIFP